MKQVSRLNSWFSIVIVQLCIVTIVAICVCFSVSGEFSCYLRYLFSFYDFLSIRFLTLTESSSFCSRNHSISNNHRQLRKSIHNTYEVLVIGDSVDRLMLHEWCARNRLSDKFANRLDNDNTVIQWLQFPHNSSIIVDKDVSMSIDSRFEEGYRCVDMETGYIISTMMIFGSNDTGPYFHGFNNVPNYGYVDTYPRVQYVLESYISQFGVPNRIILHTSQWDKRHYYTRNNNHAISPTTQLELWNQQLQEFENNINKRVTQIELFLQNLSENTYENTIHCHIGLRTTVRNDDWSEQGFLEAMNNLTRNIAIERHLFFYDFDEDVWSLYQNDYSIQNTNHVFRDDLHPRLRYTISAVDKMFRIRYSNQAHTIMKLPGSDIHINPHHLHVHRLDHVALYHFLKSQIVYLIRSEIDLYFIHRLSMQYTHFGRWSLQNITMQTLTNIFGLGPGDILEWQNDSAVIMITVDQGVIPIHNTGQHPYILASIREVADRNETTNAVIFDGYYFPIENVAYWAQWHEKTSIDALVANPLEPYWTQYKGSLLVYNRDVPNIGQTF